jgi:hypothetical protein
MKMNDNLHFHPEPSQPLNPIMLPRKKEGGRLSFQRSARCAEENLNNELAFAFIEVNKQTRTAHDCNKQ